MPVVKKLKVQSKVSFKEMSEKLLDEMKYLKQVEIHPKFMLFLVFIKQIRLKCRANQKIIWTITFSHHCCITKNKTIELISLFWRQ